MKQVLIRKQMLHGNVTRLVRAQVLSEKDGVLRVKIDGERLPTEVKSSAVLRADRVFDSRDNATVIKKMYPDSPHALYSRFAGR